MRPARAVAILVVALTMLSAVFAAEAGAATPKISARIESVIGADGRGTLQSLSVTINGVRHRCAHPSHKSFPLHVPGYASKGDAFACSGVGLAMAIGGTSAYALMNVGTWKHTCNAAMTYGRFKRDGHTIGFINLVCHR